VADVVAGAGESPVAQVVSGVGAAQAVDVVDAVASGTTVEGLSGGATRVGAIKRVLQIAGAGRGDALDLARAGLVADGRGERVAGCDWITRVGASTCRGENGQRRDGEDLSHVPSKGADVARSLRPGRESSPSVEQLQQSGSHPQSRGEVTDGRVVSGARVIVERLADLRAFRSLRPSPDPVEVTASR